MKTKLEELKAKVAEIQKEIEQLEKEESKYLDLSVNNDWNLGDNTWKVCDLPTFALAIRQYEEYKNKGFFLSDDFNWEIVTDSDNMLVLLPTKK